MAVLSLPQDYGYVISAGLGATFMVMWKGIRVGMARKKYGVEYPDMYSKDSRIFNCIQRAHQNTLENLPQFFFLLTMGGVSHPILAGAAGWMWVVGGIFNYINSDPDNSSWVFKVSLPFRWLGMLTLFGCSCHTAVQTFN